jgi:hypothetical protein
MPTPNELLAALTALANDWWPLAVLWHAWLGVILFMLVVGWRPPARTLGRLTMLPVTSVAIVASMTGNPFNSATFTLLAVVLVHATIGLSDAPVRLDSRRWVAAGAALILFGWTYPHFLRDASWTTYLYAAPFGILPCPTLSVAIGITLVFDNLRAMRWGATLAVAGILYGAAGVFVLGVLIDGVLLFGALMLGVTVLRDVGVWRSVRADRSEHARSLPGDDLIPTARGSFTHAITIARRPDAVFPWLVQMGAHPRAGWYSYDFLDNGRHTSATRLIPELQWIAVGTVLPALPGMTDGFTVLALEPSRSLVLGWVGPDGAPAATWSFFLEDRGDSTRLISRARGGPGYRFHGLPPALSGALIRFVHFLMQRKQLLEIARRVEAQQITVAPAGQLRLVRRRA